MMSDLTRLPINILLFGSCVVRDPFDRDRQQGSNDFDVIAFYSRTSLASMGALPMYGLDVSTIASVWERRMVEADMRKDFLAHLERSEFDFVLVDFTVETFTLLLGADGCGFTARKLLSEQSLLDGLPPERYSFDHPIYREYWVRGWKKVVDILRSSGRLDRLLVNRVYFATVDNAGKSFNDRASVNTFLDWAYAQAMEDLPDRQFIKYPRDAFVASCDHKWGRYSAHYVVAVEEACIAGVRAYVSAWPFQIDPVPVPVVTTDPDLHLLADGKRLEPYVFVHQAFVFIVPASTQVLRLRSRTSRPSELGLSADSRTLGFCVQSLSAQSDDGAFKVSLAPHHAALTQGFHRAEGTQRRWTQGDALLPSMLLGDGTEDMTLTVEGRALPRYHLGDAEVREDKTISEAARGSVAR